jgi:aminoglycoside phosphotransferase (APT) family kinase protein
LKIFNIKYIWTNQELLLDSKKLEDYLRLQAERGNCSFIPKDARNISVIRVKKVSGGMTNNINSFLLSFVKNELELHLELILKTYNEFGGVWTKVHNPCEETRRYVREFDVLERLAVVGFPVPQVYLCETDSAPLGFPFIIMQKEDVKVGSLVDLDSFADTLSQLHNLKAKELGIKSLKFPKDSLTFALDRTICLKEYLIETRHYRELRKLFNLAIEWLESNTSGNNCPEYSLIHGEYHPRHVLITSGNELKVIDWESVQIGDPAFDVGYAYHMIKLMSNCENSKVCEETAERFVSNYLKNYRGDIRKRLEFYKVVALLGVAIIVSSWVSNPVETYQRFGNKAFVRSLVFPMLHSNFLFKKWLSDDFLVNYLDYAQEYLHSVLIR